MEMEFRFTKKRGGEKIEVVALFKYLEWPLYQSDDELPAVRQKIRKARQVWGILGFIMKREGANPIISAAFYRAVVQVVLLFEAETWVLSVAVEKRIVVFHTGFLCKMAGKQARGQRYETWNQEWGERVLRAAGTQDVC